MGGRIWLATESGDRGDEGKEDGVDETVNPSLVGRSVRSVGIAV